MKKPARVSITGAGMKKAAEVTLKRLFVGSAQ
jgi:hypothetical protein